MLLYYINLYLNRNKKNELEVLKKKYNKVKKNQYANNNSVNYLNNLIKIRDEFYKG